MKHSHIAFPQETEAVADDEILKPVSLITAALWTDRIFAGTREGMKCGEWTSIIAYWALKWILTMVQHPEDWNWNPNLVLDSVNKLPAFQESRTLRRFVHNCNAILHFGLTMRSTAKESLGTGSADLKGVKSLLAKVGGFRILASALQGNRFCSRMCRAEGSRP
jgi:hypothetical protein